MRYDKEARSVAKRLNLGLFTLSFTNNKKQTTTLQGAATEEDIKTIQAAMGIIINRNKNES